MSPAYEQYLASKMYKLEEDLKYAIDRLHEIVWKYDLPFISDEMRQMIAEINQLKNKISHAPIPKLDNPND